MEAIVSSESHQGSVVVRAAGITARDLIGGLVLGVALGIVADRLPLPVVPRRGLAGVVTLSITLLSGGIWGHDMARLAGRSVLQSIARSTALSFGLAIISVGVVLSLAEPSAVERATSAGLSIHAVYTMLFVPATALVAAIGGFALGRALEGGRFGMRLGTAAGLAALMAFLAVDLLMYALGWRVGAPNAARRATMLVVTAVSASAAAVAAGAALGAVLRPRQSATPREHHST
jgi:hypothetical protein